MTEYKLTIGLEVHAELRTKSKMFCPCKNDPDEKHPNINICPVCMGHPGTLPVINEEAVRLLQRVGRALGGELQKNSRFDRKNYFYPDIPKGYQISQYKFPLVLGGTLKDIRITRVHLEEDTARLVHFTNLAEKTGLNAETRRTDQRNSASNQRESATLVDFNRAGIPLMELVTEPDLHNAKEAREFAEELQLVFQYLGASEANMEKGEMRCEANISVSDQQNIEPKLPLGTKVEVKNLNSFRAVERAIEYEFKRQVDLLESGGKVVQETRGWDENKEITFSQRSKESAHDYRYFPEPDLPPMEFSDEYFETLSVPELPEQKRKRLLEEYKLEKNTVEILIRDRTLSAFWEGAVSELKQWLNDGKDENKFFEASTLAVNYITVDLAGLMKDKEIPSASDLLIDPENFAELIKMILNKEITSRVAKDVLREMVEKGGDPSNIIEEKGLKQMGDGAALEEIVKKIIEANTNAVADFKKGKQQSLQFLVGQVMKETKGAANPAIIKELLAKLIK
ncbi:Asp-tRNA(Asn)/Glu-tRNA(Gln) amidotransferase subunit GatB [Candidatus Giovannonibacteria bacterium]|nr:Asp-tRNA(Asn)/Glu-tRNA(Gln) amidotransferase subunit GatB [Candidatus Giovannonibacteria bacterium]